MRTLFCTVVAWLLLGGTAAAYPQFQLGIAERCSQCHYAPAGGGLISGYGRYTSETDLSRGGDGGFLHGAWTPPDWIALGGDFRYAGVVSSQAQPEGPEYLAFPMQADLYARLVLKSISLNLTGGVRGTARPREVDFADRLISREHYLMWQPDKMGWYARAGRFFAPYGLRLAEHTSYTRRFLGFGLYEEPFAVGAGYIQSAWELHVTALAPTPYWSVGAQGWGGAAQLERRIDEGRFLWGAQAMVRFADDNTHYQTGAIAKWWLEDAGILLMAELDGTALQVRDASFTEIGWVGHLSASKFIVAGVLGSLGWEGVQHNVQDAHALRQAALFQLHWFPWAHVEVMAQGRLQLAEHPQRSVTSVGFLQLHYYL